MIFSSRKRAGGGRGADSLESIFAEMEDLSRTEGAERDPDVATRLLELRHRAGLALVNGATGDAPAFAHPDRDGLAEGPRPAEIAAGEVTPELLRGAMLTSGCLLIRGLVPPDDAARLVEEIDRAYEARDADAAHGAADPLYFRPFEADDRFELASERRFVSQGAGLWAADSPRVMVDVLETFERVGLQRLATEYLGERSAISVNKCLLRKVTPQVFGDYGDDGAKPSAWHQDGAFLGEVRALNVWLALTRCGDVAPGLDIVPRRVEHIVPTGTEGASFDWSVSRTVAEEAAGDAGIVRPVFEPGDALLFDELFLHSTAAERDMPNTRYAVESWFFGRSGFPRQYAPLAF
jgi:hypothetical protein